MNCNIVFQQLHFAFLSPELLECMHKCGRTIKAALPKDEVLCQGRSAKTRLQAMSYSNEL
jgi:hypothetical protein